MRFRLANLGTVGIITDRPDFELPLEAWSDGINVCFRDGYAQKIPGDTEVYASPGIRPQWGFNYKDPVSDSEYWIYSGWTDGGIARIYSVTSTTHTNITRKRADAAISAITAANPTHVTIASTTYVDGDEVTITGSDSTPSIDGTYTLTKVSATEFTIPVNVTGAGSAGTASIDHDYVFTPTGVTVHSDMPVFTSTVLNGLPILNCSADIPQKWDRTSGALKANMENLANWTSTWTCKSLRSFKGFLIAMDVKDTANTPARNPYRVAWSDVIDTQFSEPSTWTAAASNLAGDVFLTDTDGYVVDGVELRGSFIVFKTDATYLMEYVGGNTVFSFRLLFNKHGLLAPNCFAKVKGERVFFVTSGDVMMTDGNTAESIADSRVREKIFSEIDPVFYQTGGAYCVEHYAEEEVWFCYSTGGDNKADKAAIWNYETGAWSFRELDNAPCIAPGFIEIPGGAWTDYSGTAWSAATTIWAASVQSPGTDSLLVMQRGSTDTTANAKFLRADDSHQHDGANIVAYLQRTGLDIVGEGIPQQSPPLVKYISRLYPKLSGGPVNIRIGTSMNEYGPYSWSEAVSYNPTSGDYKVDVRATGRYFGFEIKSEGNNGWELASLDIDMEVVGDGR